MHRHTNFEAEGICHFIGFKMFHNISSIQILQLCVLQKAERKSDVLCSIKPSTNSAQKFGISAELVKCILIAHIHNLLYDRGSSAYTVFLRLWKKTV